MMETASDTERSEDVEPMPSIDQLDAFLSSVESRLRNPYSPLELAQAISSCRASSSSNNATAGSQSGGPTHPKRYLTWLTHVLDRMAKPIQLRVLLGLLGLEPDVGVRASSTNSLVLSSTAPHHNGTHNNDSKNDVNGVIWQLLTKAAEDDDDEWVRVVAGLVRGQMFTPPSSTLNGDHTNHRWNELCRAPTAERVLKKTCDTILAQVQEHASQASEAFEEAERELELLQAQEGNNDDDDDDDRAERILDSYLLTNDAAPLFAPHSYTLLGLPLLKSVLPECDENPHFSLKKRVESIDILQQDSKAELQKAQEEQAELEHKERLRKAAQDRIASSNGNTNSSSTLGMGTNRPVSGVGGVVRPRPGMSLPNGDAMGVKRRGATASASMFIRSRGGPAGGRGATALRAGRGRGNMAASMGRSLATPLQRNSSMVGRAALVARGGAGGGLAPTKTGTKISSTKSSHHQRSKMKMIDVDEVEGLTKEHKERGVKLAKQETKESKLLARKRKILEDAAAAGIRANKKWGTDKEPSSTDGTDTNTPVALAQSGIDTTTATINAPENHMPHGGMNATSDTSFTANSSLPQQGMEDTSYDVNPNVVHAPTSYHAESTALPPQHAVENRMETPSQEAEGWRQLLDRSNRITPEDRHRVEQFFNHRANPTPHVPLYKMKLHEEKTYEPETNLTTKETLYLELDYNTFGFKKLRKVKKK